MLNDHAVDAFSLIDAPNVSMLLLGNLVQRASIEVHTKRLGISPPSITRKLSTDVRPMSQNGRKWEQPSR